MIFTIGYGRKTPDQFYRMLADNTVTCVADVRLRPKGYLYHWHREGLERDMKKHGIRYEWIESCGNLNPPDQPPKLKDEGACLRRLRELEPQCERLALLCAEDDPQPSPKIPYGCHRLYIAERLSERPLHITSEIPEPELESLKPKTMEEWEKRARELHIPRRDRELMKVRAFLKEQGLLEAMERAAVKKQMDLLALFHHYIHKGLEEEGIK